MPMPIRYPSIIFFLKSSKWKNKGIEYLGYEF